MPLSRRGFLKAAATGLVVVAAMPNLAEAEARRFWSLDRSMLGDPEPFMPPIRIKELTGFWDLRLTPVQTNDGGGVWAVWLSRDGHPTQYSMIPVAAIAHAPMENLLAPFYGDLLKTIGPQAELGQVEYGYSTRGGIIYRPIMAEERDARDEREAPIFPVTLSGLGRSPLQTG